MRIADADILILPGLGGIKPGHWQTRWAEKMKTAAIVEQADWWEPNADDWVDTIVTAAELSQRPGLGINGVSFSNPPDSSRTNRRTDERVNILLYRQT